MSDLPHLRLEGTQESTDYTYAGGGPQSGEFELPRRNKPVHVKKIRRELREVGIQAAQRRAEEGKERPAVLEREPEGLVLTFRSDPNHELNLDGLERMGRDIQLLGVTDDDEVQVARVFVPEGELIQFLRRAEAYANSVVMTLQADVKDETKLRDLADDDKGIKFRGPVYKLKENKIKFKFVVAEAEATQFQKVITKHATLLSTSRLNENLIDSIASVQLAVIEDFWQDTLDFPGTDEQIWWEVWLRGTRVQADDVHGRFKDLAADVGISRVSDRHVAFPERVVVHALATARQLSESIDLLAMLAELRKVKELATYYVELPPRDQRDFVNDIVRRLVAPGPDAPSVCIFDGGVNRQHPLIEPALALTDAHAVDQAWGTHDHDSHQHGTGMAGIALYGCLTEVMRSTGRIRLRHRLESVKILPPPPGRNEAPVYGRVTQDAAARAQIQAPRRNRVLCLAVTADDRDMGLPSTWSAAVDDLCAGVLDEKPKLMFISTGNVRDEFHSKKYRYHKWNTTKAGIEDPGQSWNAITVGAITDKVLIQHQDFEGWDPIAERGDLCPTSRTSIPWPDDNQKGWPIKPDLVMEGGNYAESGDNRSSVDDLSLLTTILHPSGRLVETTRDTSPATAAASRFAAILWSHYPRLWPETVRALLIHSARWTDVMRERFSGDKKSVIHQCLRCYGYGVPDLKRALNSAENAATLIFEGELQPFYKDGSTYKTYEMHLHTLPWPVQELEELGEAEVRMRVTLSYFIEPSPNRVGWGTNHRYLSHGLRFDVIRLGEGLDAFKKRISRAEWDTPKTRPDTIGETRNWVVGENGRTHGSIHSDWWVGKGVELAWCNRIAVYPVTGWWKERHHLGRYEEKARYSLVVTIETDDTDVNLYAPIRAYNTVETEVMA